MSRPRALLVVGFLTVALGALTNANAVATLAAYTTSRDTFTSAISSSYAELLRAGIPDDKSKDSEADRAEVETISTRRADALWENRNITLPLAGLKLFVGTLLLVGAMCTTYAAGAARSWGRSTWQLAALVGVPCEVLGAFASHAQAKVTAEHMNGLTSPFAQALQSAPHSVLSVAVEVTLACAMLSVAGWLSSAKVRQYADTPAKA